MRKFLLPLSVCLAILFAAVSAHADSLTFTSTDHSVSFNVTLPAGTPTFVATGGFAYYVPQFTFNGSQVNGFVGFYDPAVQQSGLPLGADFGISISSTGQSFYFSGAKLYSGPENAPVYPSASYFLTGVNGSTVSGTIAINPTPEPSSFALLATGFCVLCLATYSRRHILALPGNGVNAVSAL